MKFSKSLGALLLAVLLLLSLPIASAGAQVEKTRVALEDLTTNIADKTLINIMTDHLKGYLDKTGGYEIVPKDTLTKSETGLVISGSLVRIGEKFILNLRLVDLRRDQLVRSERETIHEDEALPGIERMASKLMGFVPTEEPAALAVEEATGFGFLHIRSVPADAALTLNGREMGNTPKTIEMLEAGRYKVKIVRNDFFPWEKEVFVRGGSVIDLLANLKTVYGELKVVTEPPGAEVFVDGERRGTTPITLAKVLNGEYAITLKKEGYYPYEKRVTVSPGETAPVTPLLNERPEHREFRLAMEKRWKKQLWAWGSLAVGGVLAMKGISDRSASDKAYSEAESAYRSYQVAATPSDAAHYRSITEQKSGEGASLSSSADQALLLSAAALGVSFYHFYTLPSKSDYRDAVDARLEGDRLSLAWSRRF